MLSASKSSSSSMKLTPLLCTWIGSSMSPFSTSMDSPIRIASGLDSINSDSGLMYVLFIFIFAF